MGLRVHVPNIGLILVDLCGLRMNRSFFFANTSFVFSVTNACCVSEGLVQRTLQSQRKYQKGTLEVVGGYCCGGLRTLEGTAQVTKTVPSKQSTSLTEDTPIPVYN